MIDYIRQITFSALFYAVNIFTCFFMLLFLPFPRSLYVKVLMHYFWLIYWAEKYILKLDYEIIGAEHIPQSGSFIVAAKHYSVYETLKIHILFNDPAIIMKKELYDIPFWGWHARKNDMIAINRGAREEAMQSLINGAQRMKEMKRPIVIFPQGTRVNITNTPDQKPYKRGLARIYEATDLPVLPLAMNSGYFWPKGSFIKKPGVVTFQFFPTIPAGQNANDMMQNVQNTIETASNALIERAKNEDLNAS